MTATTESALLSHTPASDAIKEIERLAQNGQPIELLPQKTSFAQPLAPLALVRDGFKVQDLTQFLEKPPGATARLQEVDSFIQYVTRYDTADTLLSVDPGAAQFTAHLDYHAEPPADRPSLDSAERSALRRPRAHTAHLALQKSPELQEWEEAFSSWHAQEALAEWLEDHAHQVADPAPADILTIARELSVASDVRYTKAQRAADGGYDFQYKENTTGQAGDLSVPSRITLTLPLYLGDLPTHLDCLLRYRLRDGSAQFYIRPLKLEETLRYALDQIRAKITQETGHYIHVGAL